MRKSCFILSLLAAFLIVGCGFSLKDRIVGKWSKADSTLEIAKDGTWSVKGNGPISLTFSGTYKVGDDNTIEVTTRLLGQPVTRKYKAAFNGDKLSLTDTATGKTDEYTRVGG